MFLSKFTKVFKLLIILKKLKLYNFKIKSIILLKRKRSLILKL